MELQLIKHSDILFKDILRAIEIKNISWNHPYETHFAWALKNLQDDDIHVFLGHEGKDVAYMNLASVKATVNGKLTPVLGIGNVCAYEKGKGYGLELMNQVGEYIKASKQIGLLFCKDNLVSFYTKAQWHCAEVDTPIHEGLPFHVNSMVYNLSDIMTIIYNDRDF